MCGERTAEGSGATVDRRGVRPLQGLMPSSLHGGLQAVGAAVSELVRNDRAAVCGGRGRAVCRLAAAPAARTDRRKTPGLTFGARRLRRIRKCRRTTCYSLPERRETLDVD